MLLHEILLMVITIIHNFLMPYDYYMKTFGLPV